MADHNNLMFKEQSHSWRKLEVGDSGKEGKEEEGHVCRHLGHLRMERLQLTRGALLNRTRKKSRKRVGNGPLGVQRL